MSMFNLGSHSRWAAVVLTLVTFSVASGSPIHIVSPSSANGVEGDSSITPSREPNRIQFLFPASDFANLPESQRWLVAFNYRADQSQTEDVLWEFDEIELWFSTTTTDNSTLSTIFADNHGPDKTLVHSGAYSYQYLGGPATSGPREFAEGMRFQTPFYYDPTKGNLLVEQVHRRASNPVISPTSDVVPTPGFTIVGAGFDLNATSGELFTSLPPTRFTFVPEPSGGLMAGAGAACLASIWRRRKLG